MEDYIRKDFSKLLKRNALQMRRLMKNNDTDVMRVYDLNIAELPISVDLYGHYARITDYSDGGFTEGQKSLICDMCARMLYVEPDKVIFHERKKREGRSQHEVQNDSSLDLVVKEQGLSFAVDLTKRIDTGLFLDHAITRSMVKEMSLGLDVLNLFSYTGSFSVYAAVGGAKSVTSIDLSSTYSEWCKKNLALNGFEGPSYSCITMDAYDFLVEASKKGRRFHLVILDPPSFSNSRKMKHDFDVQRDYIKYIMLINNLLTEGGLLLFSTNLGTFDFNTRKIHGYEIKEITRDIAAPGFSRKRHSLRSWMLEKVEEIKVPQEMLEPVEPVGSESADQREEDANIITAAEEAEEKEIVENDSHDEEDDELVLNWDEDEVDLDEDEAEMLVLNPEETEMEDTMPKKNTKGNAADRRYERRHSNEGDSNYQKKEERQYSRQRDDNPDRPRTPEGRRFDDDRRSSRPFDRDRGPRRYEDDRRSDSRPPRRYEDDRRSDSRSPRRYDDDRRPPRRNDEQPRWNQDRPQRRFDERRSQFGDRSPRDRDQGPSRFDDNRSERRPSYRSDAKPSWNRERPPRRFDDDRRFEERPRRFDDRPSQDRAPRRFDDDRRSEGRPRRFDDRPPQNRDQAPRRFDDDRRFEERPRRFDDRPSWDRERPPRRFGENENPGQRSFGNERRPSRYEDRSNQDRPSRPYGDERRRFDRRDEGSRNADQNRQERGSERRGGPKPYGFDQFKPTRTRGKDERPFWLDDVDKNEKKD